MTQVSDLVFWPACVRLKNFSEHVSAAVAGGFTSMAIAVETFDEACASGMTSGDIRSLAEDAGVPIRHLDTYTAWTPVRCPPDAPPAMISRFDVSMERSLDACAALGITNILATAGYEGGAVEQELLVTGFAEFCTIAAARGIWIDLEFMPFLGMPDLSAAWSILSAVEPENAGLMIDTWHFAKSGSSMELLKTIPGRYLRSVQLSDGYVAQRGESLLDDTLSWREFPGRGELPVLELLKIVAAAGHLTHLGHEVFSLAANEMSALEAGREAGSTLRVMMADASIYHGSGPV